MLVAEAFHPSPVEGMALGGFQHSVVFGLNQRTGPPKGTDEKEREKVGPCGGEAPYSDAHFCKESD
jgi:hypothetical protein